MKHGILDFDNCIPCFIIHLQQIYTCSSGVCHLGHTRGHGHREGHLCAAAGPLVQLYRPSGNCALVRNVPVLHTQLPARRVPVKVLVRQVMTSSTLTSHALDALPILVVDVLSVTLPFLSSTMA